MSNLKIIYKDISCLLIHEKYIYSQKLINGEFFLTEFYSSTKLYLENYIDCISNTSKGIFMRFNDGRGILFDGRTTTTFPKISFYFISNLESKYLRIFEGQLFDRKKGILDIDNKNTYYFRPRSKFQLKLNEFSLTKSNDLLLFYRLNQLKWQSKWGFDELSDLHFFIGIHNNEIWILLKDSSIIVLNQQNGAIIKSFFDLPKTLKVEAIKIEDIHMNKKECKIVFLAYAYYIEIDMLTKIAQIKKNIGNHCLQKIFTARSRFYKNENALYFIGRSNDLLRNNICGIFNCSTYEFDWLYDLSHESNSSFFIDPPQANKKNIGVIDNMKNLYIFDR